MFYEILDTQSTFMYFRPNHVFDKCVLSCHCMHFLNDNFCVSIMSCQIRLSYDPFEDNTNPI